MSHVLPPVNTAGHAGSVGACVAAAFGRRDAESPAAPARRAAPPTPAPVVESDDFDFDPSEVARRAPAPARANTPVHVTLGQLWAAQGRDTDEEAEWNPALVRRPTNEAVDEAGPSSGASLAASALSNMFGGSR